MPTTVAVVVNPTAGSGRARALIPKLEAGLKGALPEGTPIHIRPTDHAGHGEQLTCDLMNEYEKSGKLSKEDEYVIVAVGGDGTLGEVVNGVVYDSIQRRHRSRDLTTSVRICYFPCGTGTDFSRGFPVTRKLPELVRMVQSPAHVHNIDVGALVSTPEPHFFVNASSIGSGCAVACRAQQLKQNNNPFMRMIGGKAVFLLASTIELWNSESIVYKCRVDNQKEWYTANASVLGISNGRYFGGGMLPAPHARLDDGKLRVVFWDYSFRHYLFGAAAFYKPWHLSFRGTKAIECRTVEIDIEEKCKARILARRKKNKKTKVVGAEGDGELILEDIIDQLPLKYTVHTSLKFAAPTPLSDPIISEIPEEARLDRSSSKK